MSLVPFNPQPDQERPNYMPHCIRCNRPVESVSWERYFDQVDRGFFLEHVPNGCGHVEVACHGEVWRAQFYPWGFGPATVRAA